MRSKNQRSCFLEMGCGWWALYASIAVVLSYIAEKTCFFTKIANPFCENLIIYKWHQRCYDKSQSTQNNSKGGTDLKIAFWSNGRGRACVTSNLACISVLSALDCPEDRTIIFENHRNIINLESTLFNHYSNREVKENYQYEVESGLGKVLRIVEQGEEITKERLYCQTRDYLGKRLFYLPSNDRSVQNLEYYMEREAVRTMRFLEQHSDRVLVDTTAAPLVSSRKILQKADMVVVNLSQNLQFLEHFFRNYSSIQKRAFYLVGNYDANSQLTRGEIMKRYNISGSRIGVIPHNVHFSDAISNGQIIPFLLKNYSSPAHAENHDFMVAAREAVGLFHYQIRKYERGGGEE